MCTSLYVMLWRGREGQGREEKREEGERRRRTGSRGREKNRKVGGKAN